MNSVQQSPAVSRPDVVSAVLIDPETRAKTRLNAEQVAVATAAAELVFAASGVMPMQAAQADFDFEGWDHAGFPAPGPTSDDYNAAQVWLEAQEAAQKALALRWPRLDTPWVALQFDDIGEAE